MTYTIVITILWSVLILLGLSAVNQIVAALAQFVNSFKTKSKDQ